MSETIETIKSTKNLTKNSLLEKKRDSSAFLSSLSEFKGLTVADLADLSSISRFATVDAGEYIKMEGDAESTSGFIVVSGRLAMLKTSLSGKELIVELLQDGDVFGSLLRLAAGHLPAQLSAKALQKSEVLWVPVANLSQLLKKHPILFKEFVAHLLLCLHSSYSLSRGLAHDRVEVRIAVVLYSLALKSAKNNIGEKECILKFTRQQIADLTGTTPETAIRVTRQMQRDRLIDIKRPGHIRIVNLKKIQQLAGG